MKKIIILGLIVLLLTACTGKQQGSDNKSPSEGGGIFSRIFGGGNSAVSKIEDFRRGYDGITFKFLENAPPKERFENEFFSIMVELQNRGAYDVQNGIMEIRDYKQTYTTLGDSNRQEFSLEGRNALAPEGALDRITISAQNTGIPKQSQGYTETFTAMVCYPYKTILVADICLASSPDLKSASPDACNPTYQLTFSGQGAPVAVNGLQYDVLALDKDNAELRFKFQLQNKGKGLIIDPATTECDKTMPVSLTSIYFLNYSLGNEKDPITCSPENKKLNVTAEPAEMICSMKIPRTLAKTPFVTPLRMTFEYGYRESRSTAMKIKKRQ
ncbi:hypothetical protein HZB01_00525 [Candidatus Woesearchaeota archaeon]|nr:hypothetical protein [Candidatus Woesearchaeota archaeon]